MFRMVIRTLPEGFLELEMVLELLRGGGGGGRVCSGVHNLCSMQKQ